ncbi:MAG: hypothetical protein ACLRT4_03600 [Thomasclavelia sp.]
MAKTNKYNLNYIGGIDEYKKRTIYTLNIMDDGFSVDGLFKKKKFSYNQVVEIKYGEIDVLKETSDIVRMLLFDQVALLDLRNNRKIKYCLMIQLKERTILFAEQFDVSLKNAYANLLNKVNQANK